MNKKFTLLAAALMTVGTFTAASAYKGQNEKS